MVKTTALYPQVRVDSAPVSAAGSAGGVLLTKTAAVTGLGAALVDGLGRWMKPFATHRPGKVLTDLAISVALGGDCLADAGLLRAEPGLFGPVGSEATISRTITALARDADRVIRGINTARAAARARAWELAGDAAPNRDTCAEHPLIVDIDATLVTAHSEKEKAAPTFKRGFGFHPLCAFLDHGQAGTGEPLAMLLRAGNAGSNTAADHIAVTTEALKQLPGIDRRWPGRKVLIRTDGAGGTKEFLTWLVKRNLSYSVGFTLPAITPQLYALIPEGVWSPALDSDEEGIRKGAAVAEITDLLRHHGLLTGWPKGIRVIIRRERPHPGAQLRFDDVDGYRITGFATNTTHGQLQQLELRHRRRARCEDRIRIAKDTGLANLPLKSFNSNRIWCHLVMLAGDLTAWMQLLAFEATDPARRWEPKRVRHRIFSIPAVLVRHARQQWLRIKTTAPWAPLVLTAHARLAALGPPI
ncbi:IS1380 family transposase [Branchiibius cervicis]|uniref:IS1380 family transposase n=1 Tax=Branchiibius cervicis TaxID=908252 RepID=A0ABW2ATR7_9MICO